jgi:hypothetical protein
MRNQRGVKKTVQGRYRSEVYETRAELKRACRAEARRRLESLTDKSLPEDFGEIATATRRRQAEQYNADALDIAKRLRGAVQALRSAAKDAAAFQKRDPVGGAGQTARLLRGHDLDEHFRILPRLRDFEASLEVFAAVEEYEELPKAEGARRLLVRQWDTPSFMGIGRRATMHELALVVLACGILPDDLGDDEYTFDRMLEKEAATAKKNRTRARKADQRRGDTTS